ncbi:hypothetical protein LEP1GSC034_2880 [Leptospira interrogans str. 2003000735]|uniref:Uncharacterized protein n=13 Tax=Leptospira interrogans TaxID=173 RepID=A0A0E2D9U2_LEPIR|nr:hypothetical protein G436_1184 [Leptospira interrogans serovar Hardjo str. Norma]EJO79459.1 hypothetical protein LEP1GSC045_2161 [Leptospira interrogans serovar Pomona str. Kennewicki LC82-25]EJP13393.1 hypothetical protein LEP1GSC080_2723 [Leptospira interrogans str. FPW2026]EKN86952.1 hypothetical protein LEP1GSC027_0012 [Leptospira interrogans str. 2002000624]EKN98183.1 hypothetical protein LEP1GSC014_1006 [Leptospira interrogans serovar Pomona str. Pomona]EKO07874.1 hypothetical protein
MFWFVQLLEILKEINSQTIESKLNKQSDLTVNIYKVFSFKNNWGSSL